MKKFIRFITHPVVISLIGLILIALLVWFAGPAIKFGENNAAPLASAVVRLMIIMALLVLWGLNNLRVQWMGAKKNKQFVEELAQNQKNDQQNAAQGAAADEIRQMNQRFTQALGTLKKLRFSGSNANKALYELPWYIIIGPPGSGKTTALANSGLDFPLAEQFGKSALQGVGGTRNCDWWFTNEAVLIDTAGRYTTQDTHRVVDSSAWDGFLSLLKKNRKRRPINGALVAISLHDLLIQTEAERIQHAKIIRTRLDELMEKLEIRFPVYLVFTKVDLVSGFVEFFEDLRKEDRDQVWGISLPNSPGLTQSPDFDFVHKELHKLTARLYDRVLWRIHGERETNRRARIHGFPQQMDNLMHIVDSFVRQTFVKNRYRFQPYLRGVYFSSGTQDGTPIDRLMSSVAANFGFARDAAQQANQAGKTYFLTHLFRQIIFPEAELVGANVRYEAMLRWMRRGGIAAMIFITCALGVIWAGSVTRHKMYMADVDEFVNEYEKAEESTPRWSKDIRTVLPPLNALAKASIVYDQENHPWLSGIGMYDSRVDGNADKAYESKLQTLLLPKLVEILEEQIKLGHEGGDLYNTFRIYMMFEKQEYMDKPMAQQWFEQRWQQQFHGEATQRKELEAHLAALMQTELPSTQLDKSLVSATREVLLRVPVSKRVYSRIKSNAQWMRPVDLRHHLGEGVGETFVMDDSTLAALKIPLLYTIDGYEEADFSEDSTLVADSINDRWVLADEDGERVDFVKDDLGEISAQVKEHYLADYTHVWNSYYRSLGIAPFSSMRQAGDVLSQLIDPVNSPLLAVLNVGKTNTQLTPIPEIDTEMLQKAGSRVQRLGAAAEFASTKIPLNAVDKRFQDINKLMQEPGSGAPPVQKIIERLAEVEQWLKDINLAPDPNKQAFQVVQGRYQSGAPNPVTTLRDYAKKMPPEIEVWLTKLADETWKVVTQGGHQHLNAEWRSKVYDTYERALAGRYPLNRNTDNELALYDFNEFFKPGGILDVFYNENMKAFLDTGSTWSNRTVDGYSMGFSAEAVSQIQRAVQIQRTYFKADPSNPSIELELKPLALDERVANFSLEVGDNRFSYGHGPKFWKPMKWSGSDENKRIRVLFEDLNEHLHDKTYTGPWAWFRLMEDADVKSTSSSNVYQITFTMPNRDGDAFKIVYEGKARSVDNPFRNSLLSAFRCPSSI